MKNLFSVSSSKKTTKWPVSFDQRCYQDHGTMVCLGFFLFYLFILFFRLPSKFRAKLEVTLAVGFKKFK